VKRVHKIIVLFIVIFLIGLGVFVSYINTSLTDETNTHKENVIKQSEKVTLQKVVLPKIS